MGKPRSASPTHGWVQDRSLMSMQPNGDGPSLELVNPALDSDLGGNWRASTVAPGAVNYVTANSLWSYRKGTAYVPSPILQIIGHGWLGVDLFFLLSGFLITGLLVAEGSSRPAIDLWSFYARRIRRLLPAFGGRRRLVGARALDVVRLAATAARRGPASALTTALSAATLTAALLPARAHRPEAFTVALAIAAALARGAEPFDVRPSPARLVLLAEPDVLLGVETAVTLRHDLALVDPDLHADAAEGRAGLVEPEVDVRAHCVQRDR